MSAASTPSELDFVLLAYSSPAGPATNLTEKSRFARDFLSVGPSSTLTAHYLDMDQFKEDVNKTKNNPQGASMSSPNVIDKELASMADFLKHSHHYDSSGVQLNPPSIESGSASVTCKWIVPSLESGYELRTNTTVAYKRGTAENRSLIALEFERALSLGDAIVKLREYYADESLAPRSDLYTGERLPGSPTRIEVVGENNVLFELNFKDPNVAKQFPSTSSRLGFALLMATKVVAYLSILRVCDAAFFSLCAHSAIVSGSVMANLTTFKNAVTKIIAKVAPRPEVLHLPLLTDNQLLANISAKAATVAVARLGQSFYSQIKENAIFGANTIDVLRRIEAGTIQQSSGERVREAEIAKWRRDVAVALGLSASVKDHTPLEIKTRAEALSAKFVDRIVHSDDANAKIAYEQVFAALKIAANKYPAGQAPTDDAEKIYKYVRDEHNTCSIEYVKYVSQKLAAMFEKCVDSYPDLAPIIVELKKQDIANQNRRAALVYVISLSLNGAIDLPRGDVIAAVLAEASICLQQTQSVLFLRGFSSTINDTALWRDSLAGSGSVGLRIGVLTEAATITKTVAEEILKNTPLAVQISERIRKIIRDHALTEASDVQKTAGQPVKVQHTALYVFNQVTRMNALIQDAKGGIPLAELQLMKNSATSLLENIRSGSGLIDMPGDQAENLFLGVTIPLRTAVSLAAALEALYTQGPAEAQKLLAGVSSLDPTDDIETEKAIRDIKNSRIATVADNAGKNIGKAEASVQKAKNAEDLVYFKVLLQQAAKAFSGPAVKSSAASADFVSKSLGFVDQLRQALQVECVDMINKITNESTFAEHVKALHMMTAVAHTVNAYAELDSLWSEHGRVTVAALRISLRELEKKLARSAASAVVDRISASTSLAVDSPILSKEFQDYRDYLVVALEKDTLGRRVPLPSQSFMSTIVFRVATPTSSDIPTFIEYKKLQNVYFNEVLHEPQPIPLDLSIFREYTLLESQRKTIVRDLGSAFGALNQVQGLLRQSNDGNHVLVADKALAIFTTFVKKLDPNDIQDEILKALVQNAQRVGPQAVSVAVFATSQTDDGARFSELNNLFSNVQNFFEEVDDLPQLKYSKHVVTIYKIFADVELKCASLLHTMFKVDVGGGPRRPRIPHFEGAPSLQDDLNKELQRALQAERPFVAIDSMLEAGAPLDKEAIKSILRQAVDLVREVSSPSKALGIIAHFNETIDDYEQALEESHQVADLTRFFEKCSAFVSLYIQMLRTAVQFDSVEESKRNATLLQLEQDRVDAMRYFNDARSIALTNFTSTEVAEEGVDPVKNWTTFKAFKECNEFVGVIHTKIEQLTSKLSEPQRKMLAVDAAALRADLLKKFGEQAAQIDKSLKETLDSIKKTFELARKESDEAEKLQVRLAQLNDTVIKISDEAMRQDQGGLGIAEMKDKLAALRQGIDGSKELLDNVESQTKELSKKLVETRKTISEAQAFVAKRNDVDQLVADGNAVVAAFKAKDADMSRLRAIVIKVDEEFAAMNKALKAAEAKSREVETYLRSYDEGANKRNDDTNSAINKITELRKSVTDLENLRVSLRQQLGDLDNELKDLKFANQRLARELLDEKSQLITAETTYKTANTVLATRDAERDKLQRKYDELKQAHKTLTTKVAELTQKIDVLGPGESTELERLEAATTEKLQRAKNRAVVITRLLDEAKNYKTLAEEKAKELVDIENQIKVFEIQAKLTEKRVRDVADKVSTAMVGSPYSRLTDVEDTIKRASIAIEIYAQRLIEYRIDANERSRQALAVPAPGGAGPPPGFPPGAGGRGGGGGGGGSGNFPPPQQTPQFPNNDELIVAMANKLVSELMKEIDAVKGTIETTVQRLSADEIQKSLIKLNMIERQSVIKSQEIAALSTTVDERLKQLGDVDVKRATLDKSLGDLRSKYDVAMANVKTILTELSTKTREIEAVKASAKDIYFVEANGQVTGSLVLLEASVNEKLGLVNAKLQSLAEEKKKLDDQIAALRTLVADVDTALRDAERTKGALVISVSSLSTFVTDFRKQSNSLIEELRTESALESLGEVELKELAEAVRKLRSIINKAGTESSKRRKVGEGSIEQNDVEKSSNQDDDNPQGEEQKRKSSARSTASSSTTMSMTISTEFGDETVDDDELRVVFARAMALYLAERRATSVNK